MLRNKAKRRRTSSKYHRRENGEKSSLLFFPVWCCQHPLRCVRLPYKTRFVTCPKSLLLPPFGIPGRCTLILAFERREEGRAGRKEEIRKVSHKGRISHPSRLELHCDPNALQRERFCDSAEFPRSMRRASYRKLLSLSIHSLLPYLSSFLLSIHPINCTR